MQARKLALRTAWPIHGIENLCLINLLPNEEVKTLWVRLIALHHSLHGIDFLMEADFFYRGASIFREGLEQHP